MNELGKMMAQLREAWSKLSLGVRAAIGGLIFVAAVSIGILVWSQQSRFGVLFRVNDAEEAGEILSALDAAKIPRQVSGGGLLIEVHEDDVDRARILLAQQQLPRGGAVDFRIYDNPSPGWTRSTEKINFQRALQGELQRTIEAIDAVASARVHLTLPARATFASEDTKPTASVTIRQRPGRELSELNIRAISHLIAASVERLEAREVVIVDTEGRMLSRNTDEVGGPALDYKHDLEKDLERNVAHLLERVIGLGGVQVSVEADVDFSETKTQEEFFDPEQIATRSEATEEIAQGQGSDRPNGLAGAVSNQPGAAGGGSTPGGSGSTRVTKSRQYEVNRTLVETKGPAATLKHLTVSVLVDGKYVPSEDGSEQVFTPRSAEELQDLQTLVENAVGYNAARGDRIAISSKQFVVRPTYVDNSISPANDLPKWLPYAVGGGVLLAVGAGFLLLRRKKNEVTVEVVRPGQRVSDAQRALSGELAELGQQEEVSNAITMAALRSQVLEAAEQSPERAAEVVKAWIRDREAS